MKILRTLSIVLAIVAAIGTRAGAQWTQLHIPADLSPITVLLLTDGRVFCQNGGPSGAGTQWWSLTPNEFGSYLSGTWAPLGTPMNNSRLYYASAVLRDGRVVVAGGEDTASKTGVDINSVEIFNGSSWTGIGGPGWAKIGDAPCAVLSTGEFLIGNIFTGQTAFLDPVSLTWSATGAKKNLSAGEETWTLLPDNRVLAADCNGFNLTEAYDPVLGNWNYVGRTTENGGGGLVEPASTEIGPAILLPSGRVLAFGATGYNDYFYPKTSTWDPAPSFPVVTVHEPTATGPLVTLPLGIKDGPACLLTNGNVLCATAPVDGVSGHYLGPVFWMEYTGIGFTHIASPPGVSGYAYVPYNYRLLMLPTGQVLATNGSNAWLFDSPQIYPNAWRPTIATCPTTMIQGRDYTITGTQFNGLSQCSSYGDDVANATNYPIVRVRNNSTGHIKYLKTFNHSSMGVATGSTIVSTRVYVPLDTEGGDSQLWVVANGIPSQPFGIKIGQ